MAFKAVIAEGTSYSVTKLYILRSKGTKPYKEPLPYSLEETSVLGVKSHDLFPLSEDTLGSTRETIRTRCLNNIPYFSSNTKNTVYNKALNKVSDKLEYVSNMFEAWYERREAYALLGTCIKALHTFARRWKDPKYWRMMRKSTNTKVQDPSSLPEAWLLWQFALKPLIGTIDDIINLLSKDFPVFWVEGSSASNDTIHMDKRTWQGIGADVPPLEATYIVKHAVRVIAYNPNAQLSNIMGATTPISSFLSVVPWFWAVNYFVNINEVVSNIEVKHPGVVIDKSYTTVFCRGNGSGRYFFTPYYIDADGNVVRNKLWYDIELSHVYMRRTISTSVPKYKIALSHPTLGSNQFANLTSAIALTFKGATKGK